MRGLIGLVLLFNTYTVYQQVVNKRLRRQLSEQLEAMGRLQMRAEEFHKLATTDSLTGLANRRTAERRLLAEAARSQRYGHPLTIVALDLNNFKITNDHFGHAAGDLVLRAFAERLAGAVRSSDLAVRMGGDEFLLILPECPLEQVPTLLARLRRLEVSFQGTQIPVEFSAGSVGYDPTETPEQFLERADQHLYADKRAPGSREAPTRTGLITPVPPASRAVPSSRKDAGHSRCRFDAAGRSSVRGREASLPTAQSNRWCAGIANRTGNIVVGKPIDW